MSIIDTIKNLLSGLGNSLSGQPQINTTWKTSTATPIPSPTQSPIYQGPMGNFMKNVGKIAGPKQNLEMPSDLRDAITKVSQQKGIPKELLAAISHQETGFQNIAEHGGGKGRGYFQIDLGQHPGVTEAQAKDPYFAANFAADLLLNRLNKYSKTDTPVMNAIRAYNGGLNNPKTATYAQSVLHKMENFNFQ